MKAKMIVVVLALGISCFSGCKNSKITDLKQNEGVEENNKEEGKVQAYRKPTEKELEILEGCNISNESMEKVKEKGMDLSMQSFVDTAQIMLDYLEEKYGEKFQVVGGEIPGIISGDYMIFAQAAEGEHRGRRFEVYYEVDEDGKGYCEDGYFAILKEKEIQEYLQNIAKEAGTDIKVIGALEGTVGKEYIKETKIEEISDKIEVYVFGYVRPEVTEEVFQEQVVELEQELEKRDFYINYTVVRLLSNEKYDYIMQYSDIGRVFPRGTEPDEKYDLRYHSTIKNN